MQLLIILALLLYGGKSGAQNLLKEVKPVLESIGGDEMREALKSAEEISTVLSAVNELSGSKGGSNGLADFFGGGDTFTENENTAAYANGANTADGNIAFPLRPISNIADRDITYSLSRFVMQN